MKFTQPHFLVLLFFFILAVRAAGQGGIRTLAFPEEAQLSEEGRDLWQRRQALEAPRFSGQPIVHWQYSRGDSAEGLRTPFAGNVSPDSAVSMPHRVLHPNTPLWYAARLPAGAPRMLHLNADDGAQVYVDGKFLPQSAPNFWRLPAAADSLTLTVRVLNNAMAGGLRSAQVADTAAYRRFGEKLENYRRLQLLTLLGLNYPASAERRQAIRNALQNPETALIREALSHYADSVYFLVSPFAQQIAPGRYRVVFRTNHPAPVVVCHGADTLRWSRCDTLDAPVASFTGLPEDTTYYYQLEQAGARSAVFALRTLPARAPFSFAAWGDSQGGWATFQALTRRMAERPVDFTIGLGDLVGDGSRQSQWLDFLRCLQPIADRPTFPVPGNHDYDGYYDDLYPAWYHHYLRAENYFAWTAGNAAFIALDANADFPIGIKGQQEKWLAEQLQTNAWQSARWRFILIHHPPYSQGWPGYRGDDFIREWIENHAAAAGIDFVLSGHTHDYERLTRVYDGQTVNYFILGGGGGSLEPEANEPLPKMDRLINAHHYGRFEVSEEQVQVEVIGPDGEVLEKVVFGK